MKTNNFLATTNLRTRSAVAQPSPAPARGQAMPAATHGSEATNPTLTNGATGKRENIDSFSRGAMVGADYCKGGLKLLGGVLGGAAGGLVARSGAGVATGAQLGTAAGDALGDLVCPGGGKGDGTTGTHVSEGSQGTSSSSSSTETGTCGEDMSCDETDTSGDGDGDDDMPDPEGTGGGGPRANPSERAGRMSVEQQLALGRSAAGARF